MKRCSSNLREAFAANPTRFLAAMAPPPPDRSSLPTNIRLSQQIRVASASSRPPAFALIEQLRQLGLRGMERAMVKSRDHAPSHTDWLAKLLDGEIAERKERRIEARLRAANLRYRASMADVDYHAQRGFDDSLFHTLAIGHWIEDAQNLIIEGPTGVGKTWLACALGEKACHDGQSVRYERVSPLLVELGAARGTARYTRRMRTLQHVNLLILDDWGLEPLGPEQRHDMLEILEHRYGSGSTLIASQLPVDRWRRAIGEPALAAVLLDRIVHNAHRLRLAGVSLRQRQSSAIRHVVAGDEGAAGALFHHV
jgi:DNA replication protein DnaC